LKPTIGRIVHFVGPRGQHFPAIIYEVFEAGISIEIFGGVTPPMQASIPYDESAAGIGTWHWPEKAE